MYRRSLVLLWVGCGTALTLSITAAATGFAGDFQDLFIGIMSSCGVCAAMQMWFQKLHNTAAANRNKTEEIRSEVRDLADAQAIVDKVLEQLRQEQEAKDAPAEQDARIYQFRIHRHGQDVIVGSRSADPIDPDEIWAILDDNDTGTLPGRFSAS